MSPQQLTQEEATRLRQILAQHDSEQAPVHTIDLNNPPRQAYRFQKFPMAVYDHLNSYASRDEERPGPNGRIETVHVAARIVSRIVNSEHELKAALADGWSELAPEFREEREEPLSAKYENEANRIQERIEHARRRPGPKPKHADAAA